MFGALVVVVAIGTAIGLLGRTVTPGRRGLMRALLRDPRRAPQLLARDDEVRWEIGGGVLGAAGGYIAGRWYDSFSFFGSSPMRWYLALFGAAILAAIAIASGVIERSRWTRNTGLQSR